jgi:hypothetical protein
VTTRASGLNSAAMTWVLIRERFGQRLAGAGVHARAILSLARASHTRAVLSVLAVSTHTPSGLNRWVDQDPGCRLRLRQRSLVRRAIASSRKTNDEPLPFSRSTAAA